MTTYNTRNPLGSSAAKDLYDNAQNLDHRENDLSNETWPDRLGVARLTWFGIEKQNQRAIASYGYITMDSFQAGATLTLPNQVLRDTSTGEYYRWDGTLPKIVPAGSTPSTAGGVAIGAWVSVGDASLRANLGSDEEGMGSSLIRNEQGETLQDSVYWVTLTGQGGVADYDTSTQTGTDNFSAFRASVAKAISQGRKEVRIPAGNYYVKLTDSLNDINLGGIGVTASADGVSIKGAGKEQTTIWVDADSTTNVLFSIRGLAGSVSAKRIEGLTIRCVPSNLYKSIFLLWENTCFNILNDVNFIRGYVGVKYLNSTASGNFTEFNVITNSRLNSCQINRLFEVNGGDNSFHGNDVFNVQNQVKTTDGIGVQVNGVTTVAYLYNQWWYEHFFGGSGCTAIKLTNANTDNLAGRLTREGNLICQSTDGSSFEFKGTFAGLGTLSFSVTTPTTVKAANFVFNNVLDNLDAFTNTTLSSFNPALFNPELADTMDNGVAASIWRLNNATGYGMLFNAYAGSPGWRFTTTSGGRLQSAIPKYSLGVDGNSFTAHATTTYFNPSDSTYGVQLSSAITAFAPRNDNVMLLGTGAYRWSQVYAVNTTISSSDATMKTEPREISSQEVTAFSAIARLPGVWQWLEKYQSEGDDARLHSGPTVQAAIAIMTANSLDWSKYGAFCYDSWEESDEIKDDDGNVITAAREAGGIYSFRKEELIWWCMRAIVSQVDGLVERVTALEAK